LCPDELAEPGEPVITAQADVNFLVKDMSGNVIIDHDETITCVAGIDDGVKVIVTFGPENCGPDGGNNAGTFDIFTFVTGEAGDKDRTQRIKCRP
jgi:hypothetical protein